MDKFKTIMLLSACLLAICNALCCHGGRTNTERRASQLEPFAHERRATLATDAWGGMRTDWTAVVDWPTGDSPAANSVRLWIDQRLRNYRREPFNGDIADWDDMARFYGEQFLSDNGSKDIEKEWRGDDDDRVGKSKSPDVDPGEDVFLGEVPKWFCNNTAIIEYEDERIVSYRAGFYGFFIVNATSAAYVKCATFRKQDGKILGWDAFADTNVVFELVRELAKVKFKEGADIYETGIPIPAKPLFTVVPTTALVDADDHGCPNCNRILAVGIRLVYPNPPRPMFIMHPFIAKEFNVELAAGFVIAAAEEFLAKDSGIALRFRKLEIVAAIPAGIARQTEEMLKLYTEVCARQKRSACWKVRRCKISFVDSMAALAAYRIKTLTTGNEI